MNTEQFSLLFRNYLLPSTPGRTLTSVLEIHADSGKRAADMLPVFSANPAYAHFILTQKMLAQKVASWNEEVVFEADREMFLTKQVLGLFGKAATRNLVAAFRIARMTAGGSALPRKKDAVVALQPRSLIPLALQAEEYCSERGWSFPESAFVAGMHYDWLQALFAAHKVAPDAKATLTDAFREGLRAAECAHVLALHFKRIHYHHHLIAAALVLPLGKALMAVLFPKGGAGECWSGQMTEAGKYGSVQAIARDRFEEKHFGTSYAELSAHYVQAIQLLQAARPAVFFALRPWMLKDRDSDSYQLAMILAIAARLGNSDLSQSDDLPLPSWQRDWLTEQRISEETVLRELRASQKKGAA